MESIETRSTFIKTYDGKRIIIPNGEIYMTAVEVNTAFETRRTQYDIGIGCNDSIPEAREAILNALKSTDGVVSEPAPQVLVVGLADFVNVLRARWWTKSPQSEVMVVQDRVITAVEAALTENAIDMPYPTQVHLFHDRIDPRSIRRVKFHQSGVESLLVGLISPPDSATIQFWNRRCRSPPAGLRALFDDLVIEKRLQSARE